MESKKTLHDLGFRKKSDKKKRSRKSAGKEPPVRPPTSTTLDDILNRAHSMQRFPPPDAPSDTDIHIGGHTDTIRKSDDLGFET